MNRKLGVLILFIFCALFSVIMCSVVQEKILAYVMAGLTIIFCCVYYFRKDDAADFVITEFWDPSNNLESYYLNREGEIIWIYKRLEEGPLPSGGWGARYVVEDKRIVRHRETYLKDVFETFVILNQEEAESLFEKMDAGNVKNKSLTKESFTKAFELVKSDTEKSIAKEVKKEFKL